MICPNCKAEYREGFTRCSDCEVDLVDNLDYETDEPIEYSDPDIKIVEILRTNDLTDVIQIKGLLDSEGIQYFIKGDLMSSIEPLDYAAVMVSERDAERTLTLLKSLSLNFYRFIYKKP